MFLRRTLLLVLGASALGLSACRSAATLNPETSVSDISPEKLKKAIILGATRRKWKASVAGPGHIIAIYTRKNLVACVDIYYDARGYRIVKNSKTNMDTGEGEVNRHYNKWVKALDQSISREVALATI